MRPFYNVGLGFAFIRTALISTALISIGLPTHAQSSQITQIAEVETSPEEIREEPKQLSIDQRLEQDMIAMPDLVHALAKNLGQLHYLRTVCFGKSDQTWREYAANMMDIEAPSNMEHRRELIGSFNDGFYDQQARHSECSENVSAEAAAIAENGRHLASMLGDPYRE